MSEPSVEYLLTKLRAAIDAEYEKQLAELRWCAERIQALSADAPTNGSRLHGYVRLVCGVP